MEFNWHDAGLCRTLDQDNPEQCIIRETEEETTALQTLLK
jgi:hypothetical protein